MKKKKIKIKSSSVLAIFSIHSLSIIEIICERYTNDFFFFNNSIEFSLEKVAFVIQFMVNFLSIFILLKNEIAGMND